jgi:hypothetical protein
MCGRDCLRSRSDRCRADRQPVDRKLGAGGLEKGGTLISRDLQALSQALGDLA